MLTLDYNTSLKNYIMDPKNPMYNFVLGKCYEDMGQTASAASFYIRTAEFSSDDLLSYEALLRVSLCFARQGSRVFTIKGILLRAVSLLPNRPEAYFLLSRTYEINKDWQESYTWAILGEKLTSISGCYGTMGADSPPPQRTELFTNVEYPGPYSFTFERAVAAWWIGLYDESIYLFRQLEKNTGMLEIHKNAVRNNIKNLGNNWKEPILYDDSLYERLKVKFNDSSTIKQNYSQCYQDMFVLTMLDGKRNGKFLEIGCGEPYYGNNTALLENSFGWNGISIDIVPETVKKFAYWRKSKAVCADATRIDYDYILDPGVYDYLQIDCDPAIISFNVLLKIPFETHKFAVITFEHDFYTDEKSGVREKSRNYLESHGYELVVSNIAPDKYNSYEDWWIHPDLVNKSVVQKMRCLYNSVNKADEYMLNRIF